MPVDEPALARALATLGEDLAFFTVAAEKADTDLFQKVARRRADVYGALLRGVSTPTATELHPWVLSLTRAMAPVEPPTFIPMHELVSSGVSLSSGARGMRSLFSSKPSEKDVQRVRALGAFAVKVAVIAMATDGPLVPEEMLLRDALVSLLGLPAEDETALFSLQPSDPASLPIPSDLDPKSARLVVRGAWVAAAQDGLDSRDEAMVVLLANRLGIPMQDVGGIGAEVKKEADARHALAAGAAEGIAFVTGMLPAQGLSRALIELAVPAPFRARLLATDPNGALTPRTLDKTTRGAVLAIAWAAAMGRNPSYVGRARLAARHDRLAEHVGAAGDGPRVRGIVEAFLDAELSALAAVETSA
jgi:hypothetical protein